MDEACGRADTLFETMVDAQDFTANSWVVSTLGNSTVFAALVRIEAAWQVDGCMSDDGEVKDLVSANDNLRASIFAWAVEVATLFSVVTDVLTLPEAEDLKSCLLFEDADNAAGLHGASTLDEKKWVCVVTGDETSNLDLDCMQLDDFVVDIAQKDESVPFFFDKAEPLGSDFEQAG